MLDPIGRQKEIVVGMVLARPRMQVSRRMGGGMGMSSI